MKASTNRKLIYLHKFEIASMKFKNIVWIILLGLIVSCKSKQNADKQVNELQYLRNIEQIATETAEKSAHNILQPADQLVILVSGKDMDVDRKSVV